MSGTEPIYLDSSALLRVVFAQGERSLLARRLRGATAIHTSRLTLVECERAVLRLRAGPNRVEREIARIEIELQEIFDRAEVREISASICALAGRIAPMQPLRSLDAIHLATWRSTLAIVPDLALVTADQRLAAAAGVEPILG